MIQKNNFKAIFFVGLTFILLQNSIGAAANFSAYTTVLDAYYTDSDYDGYQDDVISYVGIDIYWGYYGMLVDVYVGLTLPSGAEQWYLVSVRAYSTYFVLKLNFLNSATESGWYTVHAAAFAMNDDYSTMHSYTFDPPGGNPNNPPQLIVSIL